jgi:hypothetical protein
MVRFPSITEVRRMKKTRFPKLSRNNRAFPEKKPINEAAHITPGAPRVPAWTGHRDNAPSMKNGKPLVREAGCRS